MKKSNFRMNGKALALILAVVLVVGGVVGGTLAWLTAESDTVTNTFTLGDIDIDLDETTGSNYTMIPGNTIGKNPKVTVTAGSEDCWLFVKVEKTGEFLKKYSTVILTSVATIAVISVLSSARENRRRTAERRKFLRNLM